MGPTDPLKPDEGEAWIEPMNNEAVSMWILQLD